MTITLPYPPSVNSYWRSRWTGKFIQYYITPQGRAFRHAVVRALTDWDMMLGRLALRVEIFPPDRRRRDADNVLKALLDALEHAGVCQDDSQFVDLWIRKYEEPAPPGRVEVTVTQAAREWQPELFQGERA